MQGMVPSLGIAWLCTLPALVSAAGPLKPLSGEYGFLTVFDKISELEARRRVQHMVSLFNIREFQFYDAVRGYSQPPAKHLKSWHNKAFNNPVQRNIIEAYTDEIRKQGGRSWLYLQAAATDPGDQVMQQGFALAGQHVVDNRPLLDAIAPNAQWALKIAPQWSDFAADLGFSGIHWDTLGKFSAVMQTQTDMPGFLRTTKAAVVARGLEQTANFVDGFGWDPSLIDDSQVGGRTISFPYWETWTLPSQEDFFYDQVAPASGGGGVFVCYPGKTQQHVGEWQNQAAVGIWPFDLMIMRWQKARKTGNAYLAVGDGIRHIETQYFPANAPISKADVAKLRKKVFGLDTTPEDFKTHVHPTTTTAPTTQATTTAAPTTPPPTTPVTAAPTTPPPTTTPVPRTTVLPAPATPVSTTLAPTTTAPITPAPTTTHAVAAGWTCEVGLDNWAVQTQWPPEKQAWCCKNKQLGCLDASPVPEPAPALAVQAQPQPLPTEVPPPAAKMAPALFATPSPSPTPLPPTPAEQATPAPEPWQQPQQPAQTVPASSVMPAEAFSLRNRKELGERLGTWRHSEAIFLGLGAVGGGIALLLFASAAMSREQCPLRSTLYSSHRAMRRLEASVEDLLAESDVAE